MYAGHVVEVGPTGQLFTDPRHPYTKLLLSVVPDPRRRLDVFATGDAGRAAQGGRSEARVTLPARLSLRHRGGQDRDAATRRSSVRGARRVPRGPRRCSPGIRRRGLSGSAGQSSACIDLESAHDDRSEPKRAEEHGEVQRGVAREREGNDAHAEVCVENAHQTRAGDAADHHDKDE